MILSDIVKDTIHLLKENGMENPSLDAEVLISSALSIDRYKLVSDRDRQLDNKEILKIKKYTTRRLKFEPVAYIVGVKEFYSLEFIVNKDVLIPRPETELLVDMAVYWGESNGMVLDLCTGSGAIAVALKHTRPDLDIYASDISGKAIKIARKNSNNILGSKKIKFFEGDLFSPFKDANKNAKFNMIVSNPPYIDINLKDKLQRELSFEPESALYTENRGKKIIENIIKNSNDYIKDNGVLLLEIGSDQQEFVRTKGKKHGFTVSILNDYAGLPRVAVLKR
ncbi:MAG: peptide chain release factor N(5)-glutamine methyltransferase [Leptospirales bacterium]|nr:peptide chain release factor N(5)-glutamine methyltransferase [Leptospirales bacterium]